MKLRFLALMLVITATTFAQDTEFKFAKEGLTDFIVGSFDAPTKDIYRWTMEWVKENKTNKIISSDENQKIIFQGTKDNFLCSKAGGTQTCTSGIYMIEITFKEGRFKFDVTSLEEKDKKGTSSVINLNDLSQYYDKDGTLKKYMDDVPATYEALFNGLEKNLITFMEKKKKAENW